MSILCKYNELDLPERITFDDGKRIYYTYAADGRKLRVRYAQLNSHVGPITPIEDPFPMGGGTAGLNGGGMGELIGGGEPEPVLDETVLLTRDYCGGHVWRNDTLERVSTDYGYFDGEGTYHAYVRDHQGNVRAVVAGGEVVERDDYYPYGMPIAGACQPSAEGVQPLKYTSKELDRFNRLDLYDFGARPYDPTRCAFLTHDPVAEDDPATGPTVFCAANPVRFTDPTGMDYTPTIDHNNKTITIEAAFVYSGNSDLKMSLGNVINKWNQMSDLFQYKTKEGEIYNIIFHFSSTEDESIAFNDVQMVEQNHPKIVKARNEGRDVPGISNINQMGIRKDFIYNLSVIAHEMGHLLGLSHKYGGLMRETVGGRDLSPDDIKEILQNLNIIDGGTNESTVNIINPQIIGEPNEGFKNGKVIKNKNHEKVRF